MAELGDSESQLRSPIITTSFISFEAIPYNPVNRRNSLLGACQIISAYYLPAFYPR